MADSSNVAADIADLKTLISQLPIALYVCESPSGLIRLYNRRAAELWGHEPTLGEQRYCGALRLFRTYGSHLPHAETPMAEVVLRCAPAEARGPVLARGGDSALGLM